MQLFMGVFNVVMYIVAVHYLSSTITVFFTVRWNFILHVFDVNLHHYGCCHYKTHWNPSWHEMLYCHWEAIMSVIMSLCKEFCEALYILSYCLCLRHNFMQWQERLIFTRALRGKTFWGYVKYIFSVTRYAVVEVPTVYQIFTILSWLQCNLLALLYITTEKGHLTTNS